ncbi:MAG: PQQ-binding-like beta-propeller repeat protein [Myxococcaceae bacterium]|nr:PQQ-binding-like beta-propeller repeat protein [Myxococcaceae bacterium]
MLPPAFTYNPPPGWTLDWWTGLQMDALGNVWFRECQGSCPMAAVQRVVSLTPGGVLRFTAPLGVNTVRDTFALRASQLIADGLLITFSGDGVTALSTATGTVAWTTRLRSFAPDAPAAPLIGSWLVAPAPGVVAVGYAMDGAGVVGLSTQSGRAQWSWRSTTGGFLDEALSDEHGNLVFGTYDGSGRLVSIDLQGHQRWAVFGRADMLSAWDGTLGVLGELRPMSSGGPPVPFTQVGAPITCSWASFVGHPQDRGRLWGFTNGTCGTNTRSVFVVDLVRRMTAQLGSTSSFIRVPALTSRGTFLALENVSSQQDALVEYSTQGSSSCTISGSAIDAVIDHGVMVRMVAPSRVDGFSLPGVQLAPAGWVTSRGDSSRRGRPR